MPYLFTCPHCQTKTQVEDRYSGQAGQCVSCGEPIQLPHFASQPAVATSKGEWKRGISLAAAGVILILLLCLAYAAILYGSQTVTQLQTNRERAASMRNLEKIAAALNAYAADHGVYPLPFTTDSNSQPLHSWRVAILPYLGEDALYNSLDLSVAWDQAENQAIASSDIPAVYRHPSRSGGFGTNESGYYLIVGNATLFPSTGPLGPNQVIDDPAKTILVVEGSPITPSGLWTEPIDLDINQVMGIGMQNQLGGLIDDGVAVATVSERGHFLFQAMPLATLKALISPRGGERLADDTLD